MRREYSSSGNLHGRHFRRIEDAKAAAHYGLFIQLVSKSNARSKFVLSRIYQKLGIAAAVGQKNGVACNIVIRHIVVGFGIWTLIFIADSIVHRKFGRSLPRVLGVEIEIP